MNQDMKQLLINYKATFASETGQAVLKDLETFCGYNNPCFFRGESDMTAFTLGGRNVFLRIKKFIDADLETNQQEEVEDV
jgi:hypothetical protein